ncbi:MAG TPA: tetratricopeptide repeat protein [Candidatus Acidoferrum sp.]|nr:tetratricopeptide repeat protein [Candidatus Acidoferrum sp.]
MLQRALLMFTLTLVTACTVTPPLVREPSRSSPPPAQQPVPPPAQKPAPVVESQPVLPPEQPSAPEPVPPPEAKPAPATPASTLLASVQSAIAAGQLDRAAALCERALRISPRDAQLWYQLALIRYRQHRNDDAAGHARRALSLAGKNLELISQINALLQQISAADN